jgi:rhamnose utilization protein RhaD (predicted bifunctional aldolase and dehydrogenase)/NAD(P)-dependent dehydrogenase (short-subunit alcohol dehydrogenase family)
MQNRWSSSDHFDTALDECVHGSRLLGGDAALVLHGGGNTSVKAPFHDVTGEEIDALYVKGSGWDLASIEAEGFSPLRHERLLDLLALDALSDVDMMRELTASSLNPTAPKPSVESLLHALLPHRAVQHSHADAIVTLTNTADGESLVHDALGSQVMVVPYVMPGFDLAKLVSRMWEDQQVTGMVLLNHGLFTFADDTETAYGNHIDLISQAESWLAEHAPSMAPALSPAPPCACTRLAALRQQMSQAAGKPMVMRRHWTPEVARFVSRPDLASVANQGPLTPDHVIRTKRVPMVGSDVDAYVASYTDYFDDNAGASDLPLEMLDPAPRVVVDPELGMLTAGDNAKSAQIAADIYLHTMPVIEAAEDGLGGYVALGAKDIFDVEYWSLEQAKLALAGPRAPFTGCVALVTGAASGIGRACAEELISQGCAVAGLDTSASVDTAFDGPNWFGQQVDVTDHEAQSQAVQAAVERFGGIDVVVAAAGIFGATAPLNGLDLEQWRAVHNVNHDAIAALLAATHPMLALSPIGGRVVVVGSKNVLAPGSGASGYSASKAAVTQLARVAAIEWAADGVRVNVVHPDAVFDTGLWDDDMLTARAESHGLTVEEYKTRNLLGATITSASVAEVVVALCSDTFSATTGAQVPIDGGNDRVI